MTESLENLKKKLQKQETRPFLELLNFLRARQIYRLQLVEKLLLLDRLPQNLKPQQTQQPQPSQPQEPLTDISVVSESKKERRVSYIA